MSPTSHKQKGGFNVKQSRLVTHTYERFGKRNLIESVIGITRHSLKQFNKSVCGTKEKIMTEFHVMHPEKLDRKSRNFCESQILFIYLPRTFVI